jgi:PAS domain S-box-containing protein
LLGYSEGELYAMTFQQLTHPDDLPDNLVLLGRMLAGEIERYEVEKRVRHKDGRFIWVRARTSLQRHADGQPEHLISVFEDIGAEREEHERLQAHIAGLEARLRWRSLTGRSPRRPALQGHAVVVLGVVIHPRAAGLGIDIDERFRLAGIHGETARLARFR